MPHLQTVTPICLAINHIHHVLLHLAPHRIPRRPVVPRAGPLLVHIEVLRVVYGAMTARLDAVDHAGLQVEQDGAWDVSRIVGLVKEDVFPVAAFGRVGCEIAGAIDTVLLAELLPELTADYTRGHLVDDGDGGGIVVDMYRCYRIGRPGG